jgi:hypothetical protein
MSIPNPFPFRSWSPSPRPGSQGHFDADTAYAAGITALGITKEVGELLKNIPYVKAVAGTVLQIIKIGDVSDHTSSRLLQPLTHSYAQEIKQNRDRCVELTEVVRKHTTTLLRSLDKVSQSPQKGQLKDLEEDLSRYKRYIAYSGSENLFLNLRSLLGSIAEKLSKLANWRFLIDRQKVLDDLQRCERELNSFHQDFTVRVQS